jgi:isocitrate dehydrogenase
MINLRHVLFRPTLKDKPMNMQPHLNSLTIAPLAVPVTIAYGDGIGPDIMRAVLDILKAGGARIVPEIIEIGESVYKAGHASGIAPEAWESLRRTKVFLKAPITTPQGGGFKSLNVTIRKSLGLFANVRPVTALHPFVPTHHPDMDVVIVRENEEDLYAGIEHRQTDEVYQCLKIVSRPGCERLIRYAFDYALANGRKKVTCVTKDNIMKLTDGLFHQVFKEIGAEYPEIKQDHIIVDIGAARLAAAPEQFDVLVMPNLYGDILSDIAAEIAGSVGLAGSANIGAHGAMFEAIHGSAPDIAGKGIANPSGLLAAALMMLVHIGQADIAQLIHNAWAKTIEEGLHTADIFNEKHSSRKVSTHDFAAAVIARLGQKPIHLKAANDQKAAKAIMIKDYVRPERSVKKLIGVDVFVDFVGTPEELASAMQKAVYEGFSLQVITNRGVKVWPQGLPETFCTDHWRCRYLAKPDQQINKAMIAQLLSRLAKEGVDFVKTEHLFTFNGEKGYSMAQGQ